jgi:hypothetical protein
MIVVFPMLTDESVSLNALPGICKALEKFVLIYELDTIMRITGWKILQVGGQLAKTGMSMAGMMAKTKNESTDLLEDLKDDLMRNAPLTKGERKDYENLKNQENEIQRVRFAMDAEKYETDKRRSSVKNVLDTMKGIRDLGTVKVDMPPDQNLSLEPTYALVTTTTGTKIIGIKVIPVPVKSKEGYSLANLLTVDASMKFFDVLGLKIYRNVIRAFWSLCRGLRVPF